MLPAAEFVSSGQAVDNHEAHTVEGLRRKMGLGLDAVFERLVSFEGRSFVRKDHTPTSAVELTGEDAGRA